MGIGATVFTSAIVIKKEKVELVVAFCNFRCSKERKSRNTGTNFFLPGCKER